MMVPRTFFTLEYKGDALIYLEDAFSFKWKVKKYLDVDISESTLYRIPPGETKIFKGLKITRSKPH